jgi:two-component system response regulator HydG
MAAKRVLLVDDEPTLRRTLAILLERTGCIVDAVETGHEALEKVNGHEYDLLITDLHMPAMNGDRLALEIKQLRPHLPVLLITAHPPQRNPPKVDLVLPKPFSAQQLLEAVVALI